MWGEGPGSILSEAAGEEKKPESVRVRIAGSDYLLRGPVSAVELQALAVELDRRLRAVIDANPRLALHEAAVLCALEILDELHRLRRQLEAATVRRDKPSDDAGAQAALPARRSAPSSAVGGRGTGRSRP